MKLNTDLINAEKLSFKDVILKLYKLMGNGSINMEYPELPKGTTVTVTFEEA